MKKEEFKDILGGLLALLGVLTIFCIVYCIIH